jgi:Ca2+-binding EF-hand superfamily protein
MSAADENKDGVLSSDELEKFRPMKGGFGRRDPAAMIEHLDQNKNGTLELSELPEHKRDRLAGADTDKNGTLSASELEAHFQARRKDRDAPAR